MNPDETILNEDILEESNEPSDEYNEETNEPSIIVPSNTEESDYIRWEELMNEELSPNEIKALLDDKEILKDCCGGDKWRRPNIQEKIDEVEHYRELIEMMYVDGYSIEDTIEFFKDKETINLNLNKFIKHIYSKRYQNQKRRRK